MRERLRPFLELLASFLAPGLLLLLIGIQLAFGLRGFGAPADGPLVVLQVPGILLGWGGLVLLLPLLVWMVLDWWGYDLGGFALKGLGSAVLGIAAAGLAGLYGGAAAGGVVGAGLGHVLGSTVGTIVGTLVLLLMAAPAAVLAFSLRRAPARARPAPSAQDDDAPPSAGGGLWARIRRLLRREREDVENRWYPKQRFDAWGNELPMDFGRSRDVGGIRFADEDEAEDTPAAAEPEPPAAPPPGDLLEGEERLPTIPELLAGTHDRERHGRTADPSGGVREQAGDPAEDGPVHVGGDGPAHAAPAAELPWQRPAAASGDGLLPGVRYADEVPTDDDESVEEAVQEAVGEATAPADAESAAEQADDPGEEAATTPLSRVVRDAVRGHAPAPADTHARMAASVREGVRRSVEALRGRGDGGAPPPRSRYLEKLEASGMFEFARPLDAPATADDDPAPPKAAQPKPAKKRAAKKKAAKKTAKKKTAKKKKTARKPAARKKAAGAKPAGKTPAGRKGGTPKAGSSGTGGGRTSTAAKPKTKAASTSASPARPKAPPRRKVVRPTKAPPEDDAPQARERASQHAQWRIERLDPLFARGVEAALERGAASSMLLTRRLGLPFARAEALLARMVEAGVLGPAGGSGANPLRVTREEWAALGE